jgi:ATP/maltotriose-dependent transcriptional regulator MalT
MPLPRVPHTSSRHVNRATVGIPVPFDPVAPVVSAGIVSRRELFERLGAAARVTVLSASAGSGKTYLPRRPGL